MEKYSLIFEARKYGLNLYFLCKTAQVSVSGYYKHINNSSYKSTKECHDLELIRNIFHQYNDKIGARRIKMIIHKKHDLIINLKKIYRLKKKYNLQTQIRKKNKYQIFNRKSLESRVSPNILKQNFNIKQPNNVYSTDISYLFYGQNKRAYLSATKDLATGEIVAYNVNQSLSLSTGYEGLDARLSELSFEQRKNLIIHSDQGVHYTHPIYVNKLKKHGVTQSMSRKGNCLDNAPIESFFGHLKDEIDLARIENYEELRKEVAKYMNYYNNERAQWTRKKMTPVEYKCHLLSQAA